MPDAVVLAAPKLLHPAPDRWARRVRVVEEAGLKAAPAPDAAEGSGSVEGYAAVYGNRDKQNEIMQPGCFARSIQQAVPAGRVKLLVAHFGGTTELIGTITQAREDDHGLWIHAELSAADSAQDARQKILEGHVRGLSVGFRSIRYHVDGEVLYHDECALLEVTVTPWPANPQAQITAAKSERGADGDPNRGTVAAAVTAAPAAVSAAARVRREVELAGARVRALALD